MHYLVELYVLHALEMNITIYDVYSFYDSITYLVHATTIVLHSSSAKKCSNQIIVNLIGSQRSMRN